MEGDPFAVVESIAIACLAVGATTAYIYIRGEYPDAERLVTEAIRQSRDAGLIGDLDIELRRGAGAYICGEETALFESIEGKRGEPRNKPPFPVEFGLFGKPTVINNVETLERRSVISSSSPVACPAIAGSGRSCSVARPGSSWDRMSSTPR